VLPLQQAHPRSTKKGVRKRVAVHIPLAVRKRLADRISLGLKREIDHSVGALLAAGTLQDSVDVGHAAAANCRREAMLEAYSSNLKRVIQ